MNARPRQKNSEESLYVPILNHLRIYEVQIVRCICVYITWYQLCTKGEKYVCIIIVIEGSVKAWHI